MSDVASGRLKLFQFPRTFAIPNLSPFCCKMETWLRIAGVPYDVVDTPNPRKGPKGKLPFIEDNGLRVADSDRIIDHLRRTRGIDLDAHLDERQRATATLVQRTLEEHYAYILVYNHVYRDEGFRHTGVQFNGIPAAIRPMVTGMIRRSIRKLLWTQGLLRFSHEEIIEAGIRDWRAVLAFMSTGLFFFGDQPSTTDAVVFGALASTVLTPTETPIRAFLRGQPGCLAYAERMRERFFPELHRSGESHS